MTGHQAPSAKDCFHSIASCAEINDETDLLSLVPSRLVEVGKQWQGQVHFTLCVMLSGIHGTSKVECHLSSPTTRRSEAGTGRT